MEKGRQSWMPKGSKGSVYRSAASGQFLTEKTVSANAAATVRETKTPSGSPLGHFELRNGTVIQTVRKDVMDRALGRGEFKKK